MTLTNDGEVFTYTKEYGVSSSLIDSVYYDQNEREVLLDVDNSLYLYSGVSPEDVEALVSGDETGSVGAYYNKSWKGKFHSEYVGYWDEVEYREVDVKQPYATVSVSPAEVVSVPRSTREYSLQPIPERPSVTVSDGAKAVVSFTLDGIEGKEFNYEAATSDVNSAVEELHNYVSRIGTTGKVKRVVVEFA